MSSRHTLLLLEDIIDACQKIILYSEGHDLESFLNDEKTKDAIIRNFGVIGEAVNRIDPAFRAAHVEIEWQRIRGFRNRIVHDYFGIDYGIVWSIITSYVNDLNQSIELLLKKVKEEN